MFFFPQFVFSKKSVNQLTNPKENIASGILDESFCSKSCIEKHTKKQEKYAKYRLVCWISNPSTEYFFNNIFIERNHLFDTPIFDIKSGPYDCHALLVSATSSKTASSKPAVESSPEV